MNPGPEASPALAPAPPTGAGTGPAPGSGDVPWRPSKLRMARTDPDRVTPRRGAVAVPALASGVGLALSLPPWGFWVLAFYLAMVVLRMIGLTYHAHAHELVWFKRRPKWGIPRSGNLYSNS